MAAGEHFRASIIMRAGDGSEVVNNFGYLDNTGGATHIDTALAAGNFQTLVQAAWQAGMLSTTTFIRYRFACVFGTHAGEVGVVDVGAGVTGALDAVNCLPNEVAISLKRNTGHTFRTDRGRVFFGPIGLTIQTDDPNRCDTGNAILIAAAALLKSNLTTSGVTLKPIIVDSDGDSTENVIVNVSVADVYVQRKSRRPGVGA